TNINGVLVECVVRDTDILNISIQKGRYANHQDWCVDRITHVLHAMGETHTAIQSVSVNIYHFDGIAFTRNGKYLNSKQVHISSKHILSRMAQHQLHELNGICSHEL